MATGNPSGGVVKSSWTVSMSFPLFDLAKDLAVARSGEGTETDDPRILRRRVAGIAWAPGAILVVLLAAAVAFGRSHFDLRFRWIGMDVHHAMRPPPRAWPLM